MRADVPQAEDPELQMAPLIDCVFLLLIFFMVTASLVKSEGDLGIRLPGMVQQAVSVDMPDEQIIEVHANGEVLLNGRRYSTPDAAGMPDLVDTLERYRLAAAAANNKAMITIWADDQTRHQRIVDVMDACAAAGIQDLTFTSSLE